MQGSGRYMGFGHPVPKYFLMRPILSVFNTFKIYIRMPSMKENTFISEVKNIMLTMVDTLRLSA